MDVSKKKKTTLEVSLKSSANDHTMYAGSFNWVSSCNNDHIYFNEEWNGEYED